MPIQALSGVRVVDLTQLISGPFCTKLLADYGADVIKIEKPLGGDVARQVGPFFGDDPHPEKSGLFLHLNTNKRGITLNLKSETGKKIFFELIRNADLLVENFSPRVMPSLGLDYSTLEKVNPRLVMTSISNFGQTGPYRDYKISDIVLFGMGGCMNFVGLPDRQPLNLPGTVTQYHGGGMAAVATMTALLGAEGTGIGQWVDVSLLEAELCSTDWRMANLVGHQYSGQVSIRMLPQQRGAFPSGNYPCKDGYIYVIGLWPVVWPGVANLIGRPEWGKDRRFVSNEGQASPQSRDEFEAVWYPYLAEHTKKELVEAGQASNVPIAPINNTMEIVNDDHMKARGFWVEIEHPFTGKIKYTGAPFIMHESPWQIRRRAPLLGEHNQEVYGELGYTSEDVVRLKEADVI